MHIYLKFDEIINLFFRIWQKKETHRLIFRTKFLSDHNAKNNLQFLTYTTEYRRVSIFYQKSQWAWTRSWIGLRWITKWLRTIARIFRDVLPIKLFQNSSAFNRNLVNSREQMVIYFWHLAKYLIRQNITSNFIIKRWRFAY